MWSLKQSPPPQNDPAGLSLLRLDERATPATFTVNTTNDTSDANLLDGQALDENGKTSLRAALEQGNFDAGTHTINFDQTVFAPGIQTIRILNDELTVEANFTINGPTDCAVTLRPLYVSTDDGPQVFRIMEVMPDSTSTIKYLNFDGANYPNGSGGAILNSGTLTLEHVAVTGCVATNGGGISNSNSLTVNHASIDSCRAPNSDGGGLYCAANQACTTTLSDVTVSNCEASKGGGIAVLPLATATLNDVTIYHNNAINGGGIYTDGTLVMQSFSALTNNSATEGGGIYVSGGTSALIDTTVESNNASNWGGGVWAKNGSSTSLLRCTFNNNFASVGGSKVAYTGNNANIVTIDDCTGVADADREQVQ